MQREVYIVSGVRTAIGDFGGSLKDIPPTELGAQVAREALSRAGVDRRRGRSTWCSATSSTPKRRTCTCPASPPSTPASAAGHAGADAEPAVRLRPAGDRLGRPGDHAGRRRHRRRRRRRKHEPRRLSGDRHALGRAHGRRHDDRHDGRRAARPVRQHPHGHHGREPRRSATRSPASQQDELARASRTSAPARAIQEGRFKAQILPVDAEDPQRPRRRSTPTSTSAPTSTLEDLAKLRPVFKKDGTVTAGNASGINDGAAAVVLMDGDTAAQARRSSRWRGWSPTRMPASIRKIMGIGPVPAVQRGAEEGRADAGRHGRHRIERGVRRAGLRRRQGSRLRPGEDQPERRRGIALGHPIGATGAILTVKALYELERIGGRYALVTMCIGGGQGIAAIFERVH